MRDYDAMRLMTNSHGKLPTAIQKITEKSALWYGKYVLVGAIPIELTTEKTTMFGIQHSSKCFDTQQNVINALLKIGITRFQLDDCSWYQAH